MTCLCGHRGFACPSACVLEKGHEGDHKYVEYQQALAIAAAKELHSLRDQLAAAQAERDELKADAMRYRWLKRYEKQNWSGFTTNMRHKEWDSAIDAAIAEGGKNG